MEKPINTFIGRQWKLIQQYVGTELYENLLKACYIENYNNIQ